MTTYTDSERKIIREALMLYASEARNGAEMSSLSPYKSDRKNAAKPLAVAKVALDLAKRF